MSAHSRGYVSKGYRLCTFPGYPLGITSAMAIQSVVSHADVFIRKPECPWVWPIGVIWEHEDPGSPNSESHDAVDDE